MKRSAFRAAVALFALALALAACGDDEGGPFSPSTGEGTVTTGEGVGTTGGQVSTTSSGETTTTQGEAVTTAPGGEPADVQALLERFRETPIRTTYLMGEDEQEMTFSQDPAQGLHAVMFEGGKIISSTDSYIVCSGEGAGSQCFEMPATEGFDMASAMLGPFASLALSLQGSGDVLGMDVESESVTIAGRDGVCFTFRPEASTGSTTEFARQCIDSELGFALLLEVKEVGSDLAPVLQLLDVGDPQPEDFEPTGPVIPLPEG